MHLKTLYLVVCRVCVWTGTPDAGKPASPLRTQGAGECFHVISRDTLSLSPARPDLINVIRGENTEAKMMRESRRQRSELLKHGEQGEQRRGGTGETSVSRGRFPLFSAQKILLCDLLLSEAEVTRKEVARN